jgi:hypothetical protein
MRRFNAWLLPYGIYLAHDSAVLFDRQYQPIVRFLPGEVVVPCDPRERINFFAQLWHYSDATTPTYNARTRSRLRALVGSIPELAAEIQRRAHIRKNPRF